MSDEPHYPRPRGRGRGVRAAVDGPAELSPADEYAVYVAAVIEAVGDDA